MQSGRSTATSVVVAVAALVAGLLMAPPAQAAGANVTVTVSSNSGAAVVAGVELRQWDTSRPACYSDMPDLSDPGNCWPTVQSGVTSGGAYTFTDVAPGTYDVYAGASGHHVAVYSITVGASDMAFTAGIYSTGYEYQSQLKSVIFGYVSEGPTYIPQAGATVTVRLASDSSLVTSTTTNSTGRYDFYLPYDGIYTFTATATDGATRTLSRVTGASGPSIWSMNLPAVEATTHTVAFDANGGTGSMASQTSATAASLTVNAFTRADYTFAGWNTAANGSGTSYADGASYPFTADATLYAQWEAVTTPPTEPGTGTQPPSTGTPSTPDSTQTPTPTPTPTESASEPVEHAIQAVDDTVRYTELRGGRQVYRAPGLLANDSDTAGHSLAVRGTRATGSNGGKLILRSNGSFTYAPDPTALRAGRETFTISVADSLGETAQSQLTVAPNRAPRVSNVEYGTRQDVDLRVGAAQGLLARAWDPEGDALSVTVRTYETIRHKGGLIVRSDGSFSYYPFPGASGADSFVFEVVDAYGKFARAQMTINIGANRPPVVPSRQYSTREGVPLRVNASGGLLVGASDPDGDAVRVSTTNYWSSFRKGGPVLHPDGSFEYFPFPLATGSDTVTYEVKDSFGLSTMASARITIIANQAPVVPATRYSTSRQSTLRVSAAQGLLAGASDPDGDALKVVSVGGPLVQSGRGGTFTVYGDGAFTYEPNPASTAWGDTLVFDVEDSFGKRTRSAVTVSIMTE